MNSPIMHDFGDRSTKVVPDADSSAESDEIDVSVVIPMRNEEANVAPLCAELQEVMDKEPHPLRSNHH